MAWERRRRGTLYFYQTVRVNGRPRKLYLGRGQAAEACARRHTERRRQEVAGREALLAEQTQIAPADHALAELGAFTALLVKAALLLDGYHVHRGEWRRWRHPMKNKNKTNAGKTVRPRSSAGRGSLDPTALRKTLDGLVARANIGDRGALAELRRFLDRHPEVHQTVGDLTRLAEAAWLDLLVGDHVLAREAVQRQLAQMKADLGGAHATNLEKVLLDEIGISYLAQRQAEIAAAQPGGGSLAQAAFRLRRAESAQRRYLAALKTLVTLRALAPAGLAPLTPLRLHTEERQRA
jgi:hypothetical protein